MKKYLKQRATVIVFLALLFLWFNLGVFNYIFFRFQNYWGEFTWVVIVLRLVTSTSLTGWGMTITKTKKIFPIIIIALCAMIISFLFVNYSDTWIGLLLELAIPMGLSALLKDFRSVR